MSKRSADQLLPPPEPPWLPTIVMFRRSRIDPAQFQQAVALLRQARRVVALTGAGVSTPSGIPDFRSQSTGLWYSVDPLEVASVWSFRQNPEGFYEWMRPLALKILEAEPNAAHRALARMEHAGRLRTLITQNIDALHQRSGSRHVIEVHGHLRSVSCLQCGFGDAAQPYLDAFLQQGALPVCPDCDFILKPDVVLMGEPLPEAAIVRAQEEALRSDLLLVVGSSLEVMPAADLPALAVRGGARLILINLGLTPYDHLADVILREDVADTLPRLVRALNSPER